MCENQQSINLLSYQQNDLVGYQHSTVNHLTREVRVRIVHFRRIKSNKKINLLITEKSNNHINIINSN